VRLLLCAKFGCGTACTHTHPQRVWSFVQKSSLSFLLAGLNADEDEANDDALDKAD
jgi:hypothetical protein